VGESTWQSQQGPGSGQEGGEDGARDQGGGRSRVSFDGGDAAERKGSDRAARRRAVTDIRRDGGVLLPPGEQQLLRAQAVTDFYTHAHQS
jgi:hypothetical protein